MDLVDSDKQVKLEVKAWSEFDSVLKKTQKKTMKLVKLERFQFYEQAKRSFAIIQTGDNAKYGNIIIKKGCVLD
jgi:L-fucose mutarotase